MKLVIAEYLRTLKERDELDRLLPDLLIEMGYVPVARPQTGNRQFGVDLAVRGGNKETGLEELLLFVVKQGDIGRTEWDGGNQAVRQSINEIFDVYLKSHIDPQDKERKIRIIVATNGELKQVVQASWCGFVEDNQTKSEIEFWGLDRLAELVESHLLDEHVFRDEDRKQLRRALALSGDSDYDRRDLHRVLLRTLGLTRDGSLEESPKSGKELLKALRVVNLSAHVFASWSVNDGDSRQGVQAMERTLLWAWHRLQLTDEATRKAALLSAFGSIWIGYLKTSKDYFERLQGHCYVEDGLSGYHSDGSEFSLVAFEHVGILATTGLAQLLVRSNDDSDCNANFSNANVVADALASLIKNNGICSSPCLDRHSQDITLALVLLLLTEKVDEAKEWIRKLVRNVDYAFKVKKYVPICTDSLDDLGDEGGWSGGSTEERLMSTSWMLATLASWCAILGLDDGYEVLVKGSKECYADVCLQLWHPDSDIYQHLYFGQAQFECGTSEAPILLPQNASEFRKRIHAIVKSNQAQIAAASLAGQSGIPSLDLIASRHFLTPVAPYFWYQFINSLFAEDNEILGVDS